MDEVPPPPRGDEVHQVVHGICAGNLPSLPGSSGRGPASPHLREGSPSQWPTSGGSTRTLAHAHSSGGPSDWGGEPYVLRRGYRLPVWGSSGHLVASRGAGQLSEG